MIITVTLNPAIDQTIEIEGLRIGDTNRVLANRWDIGGKGINVARALKELGYEPLAAGFAPGALGRMIEDQLFDSGIGCEFVSVPGETRTNITILDRGSHAHTALAAPGPPVTPDASRALSTRLARRLRPGSWLVLAGSVPPPGEPTLYAELVELAARHECFTALDADGPVVQRLLELGARPTLLKINEQELERLMGAPMRSEEAVRAAAEWLQGRGDARRGGHARRGRGRRGDGRGALPRAAAAGRGDLRSGRGRRLPRGAAAGARAHGRLALRAAPRRRVLRRRLLRQRPRLPRRAGAGAARGRRSRGTGRARRGASVGR